MSLSLSLDAEATLGSGEHRDGAGVDTCSIPKRLHPRIAYVSPMLMFSPHAFPPMFPNPTEGEPQDIRKACSKPRGNLKASGRFAQSVRKACMAWYLEQCWGHEMITRFSCAPGKIRRYPQRRMPHLEAAQDFDPHQTLGVRPSLGQARQRFSHCISAVS